MKEEKSNEANVRKFNEKNMTKIGYKKQESINCDDDMEVEYDFSKGIKNPYAKMLKKQITINLDSVVIEYFKDQAQKTGIPYQSLINLYLLSCVKEKRTLDLSWK